jgi:site-specific DNA recombinase
MARTKMVAPLKGVIRCGHCGCAMGPTYARKNGRHYTYYICQKDSKRTVSRCPLKRIPAGDIEQAKQERLFKQKAQLEMELSQAREQALELMKPGSDQPGKAEMLTTVNRQAVELSKQLTHVSERCKAYQGNSITEVDVSEAFQNVEGFWEDLFPIERNRLIRLLVDRVEIRETGIDMELATRGLTTLIAELAGLACEVTERRASR